MPVALAPSGVAPAPSASGGYGTLAGSLTPPTTYMGVPFNQLPAGNQAAILRAQGQIEQPATSPTGSPTGQSGQAGTVAATSPGKVDPGGFNVPPANDFVNAGLTAGGVAAPLGAGFLASVVKGLYQQMTSGDEANTNNMSLVDRALYGPGFGEQFVNWLSSLFGISGGEPGTAFDATPGAQTMVSSLGDIGVGNMSPGFTTGPGQSLSSSLSDPGSLGGGDFGSISGDFGASQASKGGF